jgi:hypothetical protein
MVKYTIFQRVNSPQPAALACFATLAKQLMIVGLGGPRRPVTSAAVNNPKRTSRLSKAKYGSDFGAGIAVGAAAYCKIEFQNGARFRHAIDFSTDVPSPAHSRVFIGRVRSRLKVLGSFRIVHRAYSRSGARHSRNN